MQGLVEKRDGFFAVALTAMDDPEVGDHPRLVLLVAELPEHGERPLEMPNRLGVGAGLRKCKGEVVERQSLGSLVADVAGDLERNPVLFGGAFMVASAS